MSGIGNLIGEGRTAQIYEYGQGKVLKLFRPGFEHLADEEYNKHMLAQQAGAKAPQLYELYSDGAKKGLVYQRLTGQNLGTLLMASSENMSAMISEMARLHISVSKCKPSGELQSMKSRIVYHIGAAWDLTDRKKQSLLDLLESMPEGDGLCHGDFHPENIIVQDGEATIIDWLTACRGSLAADVARTIVIIKFGILSNNVPDEICNLASMSCDMYLDEMLSIGAVSLDDVEKWMPLQLAARLIEGNSAREQSAVLDELSLRIN